MSPRRPALSDFIKAGVHSVTNSFERISKVLTLLAFLLAASAAKAQTATINWTDQHQVIDGFGASDIFSPLTASQAQTFFSTTPGQGLGFSILRTVIDYYGDCTSISAQCATGTYANGAQGTDIGYAKQYGVKVWGVSGAPPASMSTLGEAEYCTDGGADNMLATGSYGAFATYLTNWVSSMIQYEGVTPIALSVTDEPDNCPSSYEGATYSAEQIDTFISQNLGPTMSSAGYLTNTKIMLPETMKWGDLQSWAGACVSDSNCNKYVGNVGSHDYDFYNCNSPSCGYAAAQSLGMHTWETEIANPTSSCVNGVSDGLTWAQYVHNWLVNANANAWHYYLYVNDNQGFDGLMCADGTIRTATYMIANWALFVRPGYFRIDSTANPQNGVYVSAFDNTGTNTVVIVAINTNSSTTSQSFSITNAPSFNSVTPWTTSASLNLAQQSAITVSADSFTYSLPASSVTTFVGTASGSAPPQTQSVAPAPPVITSIVVK
jgi:glucuronoarabinoxylan endo-1,4-beta-xylanase